MRLGEAKEKTPEEKTLHKLHRKDDGDSVDQLSSRATVTALIIAGLALSAKEWIQQSIECYLPAEEQGTNWQEYVERLCYAQNTYFVPPHKRTEMLTKPTARRVEGDEIGYYQWIPFILLLQSFMFYVPKLVWRVMSRVSGLNFNAMLLMAYQCLSCEASKRVHCFRAVADYVIWAQKLHRATRLRSSMFNLAGLYTIVMFFLVKSLYTVNAISQIFLLSQLLQINDPLFGLSMMRQLANGTNWQESGVFPRMTLCDYQIRHPETGSPLKYSVQCVLTMNVFNEKLFIVLWFWSVFVFLTSSANLGSHLIAAVFPGHRRRTIRRLLPQLPADKEHGQAEMLAEFVDEYLGSYGVFLLRAINDRVGSVVASRVTTLVWQDFVADQRVQEINDDGWIEKGKKKKRNLANDKA